jgi:hypothetical protein
MKSLVLVELGVAGTVVVVVEGIMDVVRVGCAIMTLEVLVK